MRFLRSAVAASLVLVCAACGNPEAERLRGVADARDARVQALAAATWPAGYEERADEQCRSRLDMEMICLRTADSPAVAAKNLVALLDAPPPVVRRGLAGINTSFLIYANLDGVPTVVTVDGHQTVYLSSDAFDGSIVTVSTALPEEPTGQSE